MLGADKASKRRVSEPIPAMASGSTRYVRYILVACFVRLSQIPLRFLANGQKGLTALWFMTSSSIPKTNLPTGYPWSSDEGEKVPSDPAVGAPIAAPGDPLAVSPTGVNAATPSSPTSPNTGSSFPPATIPGERMNATFVTLARNADLWEIAKSIRQVEDRFNRKFHYDWVFLNDNEFDDTFKKVTTSLISGKTHYGKIDKEHWSFPDFIDQDRARKVREQMAEKKIIYGDSVSYRHMCRFESGFFFRHPLMNQFEWYWRVEPSIELYCDINYDTFKYMRDNGKKYSFVLSLYEYVETIPTLWNSVQGFMKQHPEHIVEGNSMGFLSDDGGDTYNHCHFVSNAAGRTKQLPD